MPERFAIYYAPAPNDPLCRRAEAFIGRDAIANEAIQQAIPGIDALHLRGVTRSARRYGLHATLKAPMHLGRGATREKLMEALEFFANRQQQVPLGMVRLQLIDGFLAIVPTDQKPELEKFAHAVVEAFEPFRAPMSPAEREGRVEKGLSSRQTALLDAFGYPFVAEEFRFHMTLTDRLVATDRVAVVAAAETWLAPVLQKPVLLDRLALFHEPQSGAPFVRLADFPLTSIVRI